VRFLLSFRKRDWQFLFTYGLRAIRRVRQHIFNLTRHEGVQQPMPAPVARSKA
jgi:hypothetical protein